MAKPIIDEAGDTAPQPEGEPIHLGKWLVENAPRGEPLELPPRGSHREVPFADWTDADWGDEAQPEEDR